jgi:hypothetical protein
VGIVDHASPSLHSVKLKLQVPCPPRLFIYHPSTPAMKRNTGPKPPSPTPTAFSSISSYGNDSYRQKAPAVPALDPRLVARTHFDELSRYLAVYLARGTQLLFFFSLYYGVHVFLLLGLGFGFFF